MDIKKCKAAVLAVLMTAVTATGCGEIDETAADTDSKAESVTSTAETVREDSSEDSNEVESSRSGEDSSSVVDSSEISDDSSILYGDGDSDGDGLSDSDEREMGLDPQNPDTDGNGTPDGEEYVEQTVDISIFDRALLYDLNAVPSKLTVNAQGNANRLLSVEEYDGYLKGDSRAYVGLPLIIDGTEINGGSISFTLTENYTVKDYEVQGEHSNGLLICRYDENGAEQTVPLETDYDEESRTLTAQVQGKGIYFVIDVMEWMDEMGIDYQTGEQY